jgi:hypothetical protein
MADSLRMVVTAAPVTNGATSPLTVVEVVEQVGTSLVAGSGEDLFTIVGTPEPTPVIEPYTDSPEEAFVSLFGPCHIEGQGIGWRRIAREARSAATTTLTLFVQGEGAEDPWTDWDLDGPLGPWVQSGAMNDGTPNSLGGHWQLWTVADKVIKGFVGVEDAEVETASGEQLAAELVVGRLELTVTRRPMENFFPGPKGYHNSIGHLVPL